MTNPTVSCCYCWRWRCWCSGCCCLDIVTSTKSSKEKPTAEKKKEKPQCAMGNFINKATHNQMSLFVILFYDCQPTTQMFMYQMNNLCVCVSVLSGSTHVFEACVCCSQNGHESQIQSVACGWCNGMLRQLCFSLVVFFFFFFFSRDIFIR